MLISVTKDGIKFSTSGDIGSANINVRFVSSRLGSTNAIITTCVIQSAMRQVSYEAGRCFLRPVDPKYLLLCRQNTQVDKPEEATVVDLQEPVSLSFALRYLNSFAKASPLSSQVQRADDM